MNTLLLIPGVIQPPSGAVSQVGADATHPVADYHALTSALTGAGDVVDLLDYRAVDQETSPLVRLARRVAGPDATLALLGFLRRGRYNAIFTGGESVGIPLALLLKLDRRRPGHVTVGHRLSTDKKRPFFTLLQVQRQMDTIFLYAQAQVDFAEDRLRVSADRLRLIAFHVDDHFFRPPVDAPAPADQVCAAGAGLRDYPTLLTAVAEMPGLRVRLAAGSSWPQKKKEQAAPAAAYSPGEMRGLYAGSRIVAVPLQENDFQAGVTTILEAMAMGKAVVATRTTGQTDVIVDGETGLSVPPGDVEGWREAIERLRSDDVLRTRLGRNARLWVERHATLTRWVSHVTTALEDCARPVADCSAKMEGASHSSAATRDAGQGETRLLSSRAA